MPHRATWLVLVLLAAAATARAADPPEIPLWPEGVPEPRVPADPPEKVERGKDGIQRRTNVSIPRLLVHGLPARPDGSARPAVIVAPGGGYSILADEHEGSEIASWFNDRGIVAFTLLYRVPTGRAPDADVGPVMDARRAVAEVRRRAGAWGVDPGKIGLMGFSAGGHTAFVAGTATGPYPGSENAPASRPDCLILVYPWRLLAEGGDGLWPGVSIDGDTPPTFIAQTADDTASPVRGALTLYGALIAAKVPAELHVYEKGGHGYGMRPRDGAPGTGDWPARLADWLKTRGF
ncbi:MAG: alpha/beta hydrolase [Planctomycetaceae bacterium]